MSATVSKLVPNKKSPRQKIAEEAERLFDKLKPYYGIGCADGEDNEITILDQEAAHAGKGSGGSGDFAFITWANEQIATFETLANLQK